MDIKRMLSDFFGSNGDSSLLNDSMVDRIESKEENHLIIIDDSIFLITIGYWMGLISSDDYYYMDMHSFSKLNDMLQKLGISDSDLVNIKLQLKSLLFSVDLENNTICSISDYNRDKNTFVCHLKDSNEVAHMSFTFGSFDEGPELRVQFRNTKRTYDFWESYKEKSIRLRESTITVYNPDNNNTINKYYSPYSIYYSVDHDVYHVSIVIDRPDNIKGDFLSGFIFSIKNEDSLQKYLLDLSFPVNLKDVYDYICEHCLACTFSGPVGYPRYKLEFEKKIDHKHSVITDKIELNYGKLKQYTRTINDKTITFDGDGKWSYSSPSIVVKPIPYNEGKKVDTLVQELQDIQEDVQEVHILIKSLWC